MTQVSDPGPASLRELEAKLKPEFGPQPVPKIWNAFEKNCSRGSASRASQTRRFTDLVSLVRTAIEPFEEHVRRRFAAWLEEKGAAGITFTYQLAWLEKMRDYISASGSVDREHFELSGQWGQVYRVFGDRVEELMEELSIALAA